jgi:MFS family permease
MASNERNGSRAAGDRAPGADAPRWGVAALALPMLVASLGTSVANVALPALARGFGVGLPQAQWVVLAYLLSVTVFIVSAGRIGDILGRRRVLLAGIALLGAGAILSALAPTLGLLVLARALQGLGGAIAMGLSVAMVHDVVPKARAGQAMGVLGSMSAIGTALGPALGGLLLARAGWQAAFLLLLPPAALAYWLVRRTVPAPHTASQTGWADFDGWGSVWLGGTLLALALALTARAGAVAALALGLAALAGLALFVRHEARTATPLLDWHQLDQRALAGSLGANGLVSAVMMTTLIVGPFHLSRGLGLAEAAVGLTLALGPLIAMASGVPSGRLVDRYGSPRVASAGLAAMALATLALGLMPAAAGLAGYLAAIALLTPGYQLFQAANNTAAMAGVPATQRGAVSGVLGLSRNLGLIVGASAMGSWFAHAAGPSGALGSADAVLPATRSTFQLATVLVLLALGLMRRGLGSAGGTTAPAPGSPARR